MDQFLGEFEPDLYRGDRHLLVGQLERVLGQFHLRQDLDDLVRKRGAREVLLRQLAQVRDQLLEELRQFVLGRGQVLERVLFLAGQVVDVPRGQVVRLLDDLALHIDEVFEAVLDLVSKVLEFRLRLLEHDRAVLFPFGRGPLFAILA